jgi:hypothetical protein
LISDAEQNMMHPIIQKLVRCFISLVTAMPLAACVGAGPTTSGAAPPSPWFEAVRALPAEMAGFRRVGPIVDYERDNLGLGASARYERSNGERLRATIYLHDGGRTRSPEGAQNDDVRQQMFYTAASVREFVREGRYAGAALPDAATVTGEGAESIGCYVFTVTLQGGIQTGDAVCVTVQNKAFLKVRLTNFTTPSAAAAGKDALALTRATMAARRAAPQRAG